MVGPEAVTQRRRSSMSPRITGLGVAFLAILLVALAGASNANNSFAYLVVFALLGLFIVATAKGALHLFPVKLAQLHAESTFADRRVSVRGALVGGGKPIWGLLELSLSALAPGGDKAIPASQAKAKAKAKAKANGGFELTLPPQPRGQMRLGTLVVSTGYPAGLLRWTACWDGMDTSAWIYPAPIDHLSATGRGSPKDAVADTGDFDELCAWRDGESLAGVCWKSYARTGKRMRKRFVQASPGPDLCFDWNALPTLSEEQKRSQLCYWVVDAHRRGGRYGLRIAGLDVAPAAGERHYRRCLTILAGSLDT